MVHIYTLSDLVKVYLSGSSRFRSAGRQPIVRLDIFKDGIIKIRNNKKCGHFDQTIHSLTAKATTNVHALIKWETH